MSSKQGPHVVGMRTSANASKAPMRCAKTTPYLSEALA
jgi:hypothetical protein